MAVCNVRTEKDSPAWLHNAFRARRAILLGSRFAPRWLQRERCGDDRCRWGWLVGSPVLKASVQKGRERHDAGKDHQQIKHGGVFAAMAMAMLVVHVCLADVLEMRYGERVATWMGMGYREKKRS